MRHTPFGLLPKVKAVLLFLFPCQVNMPSNALMNPMLVFDCIMGFTTSLSKFKLEKLD